MHRTLTLLRHAKAENGHPGLGDRDRGLTERGRKAPGFIARYMTQHKLAPDAVLCSDAVRTKETLELLEEALSASLPVIYVARLYHASAREMLDAVAEHATETMRHVLIVGHNPGIHELAMKLARAGDERLIDTMAVKFPTCALASFHCHAPDWQTLALARSELTHFTTPKLLGQVIEA